MTWKPLISIITPFAQERSLLRAQLLGADFKVLAVHDLKDAASRLSTGIPHLIIVDHGQAAREAYAFKGLMDDLDGAAPLPILFLIDPAESGQVPTLLREGLDDTLIRPVRSLELLARTSSLLRNRQLLGQIRIQEEFLRSRKINPCSEDKGLPVVLLVEDDAREMGKIASLLGQVPCRTIQARTPSDALWEIARTPPHLAIVDLLFPDRDGLELCRSLKKRNDTPQTPLLMLTAVPELDNRIEGMESGPDDYLVKPVSSAEVLTRARRLLARRSGHQRFLGNNLILGEHGYTDPCSGLPKEEYFRFVYPRMVGWSQKAQLPFTVARIRVSSGTEFLKVAANIRPILRNFDLDFITGENDLSFILPETPSERARIALDRILARVRELGVPAGGMRMVTVSIGESGWDTDQLMESLKPGNHRNGKEETGKERERIVVAAPPGGEGNLAALLRSHGYQDVETVFLDKQGAHGKIRADLVILKGAPDEIPELMDRLLPSLPRPDVPILVRCTRNGNGLTANSVPGTVELIPPGLSSAYLLQRVNSSLDLVHLRSGSEEVAQFLRNMVRFLEEGDPDLQGHGQQVSNWAVAIGARMGVGSEELDALGWGGFLHDVGKIFLPQRILQREGMLSAEEFMVVKSHPGMGHDLFRPFSILRRALPIIRHHHERMDGKGYPEGLKGGRIPLLVRIVSVVEVYDTLLRRRPYRPAFSREEAAGILRDEARLGMWDREIVDLFFQMMEQ